MLARRRKEQLESLKMACPECGLHIKFAVQNLGQNIPCPQCKTTVTLRKPGTLKIKCLKIETESVLITVEGEDAPRLLRLR